VTVPLTQYGVEREGGLFEAQTRPASNICGLVYWAVAVIVPGGMDGNFMKRREAQDDKYWKGVEERLIVARAKDADYTARELVDPGSSRAKKGSRSLVSSEAHDG